jgi:hypothetical protein
MIQRWPLLLSGIFKTFTVCFTILLGSNILDESWTSQVAKEEPWINKYAIIVLLVPKMEFIHIQLNMIQIPNDTSNIDVISFRIGFIPILLQHMLQR